MSSLECRAELVLAERRGELPKVARQALESHLRVCDSCRTLREFAAAFDAPQQVEAGDAARLDAMLAASEQWLQEPRTQSWRIPWRRRYRGALLAAALVAGSVAAAAATMAVRASTAPSEQQTAKAWPRASVQSSISAATGALIASQLATLERYPAAGGDQRVVSRDRVTENPTEPEASAEQLLQQATSARRSGNTAQAIKLFRKLQHKHPNSREAGFSLVAFGSLLLETAQPAAALDQFNRYLASSSGLSAEALYGKGRALAQLARTADERATWRQLIARFPSSPYVTHARKRLALSP